MNRFEIGSEFWDVPLCDEESTIFPLSAKWFQSGRSAISFIIQDIKKKRHCSSVELPEWCCDSVILPFLKAGFNVRFYPVSLKNDTVDIKPFYESDIVFLIDYFGYNDGLTLFQDSESIVIRDITHSIFSTNRMEADYYCGSVRKWCGLYTGGFAWASNDNFSSLSVSPVSEEYLSLRKQAMNEKKEYLSGKRRDKNYLNVFRRAEDILNCDVTVHASCSEDDINVKYLNSKWIIERRRENAQFILDNYKGRVLFQEIDKSNCPMFVPVLSTRRDQLRKYLAENRIYLPVHWPISSYHSISVASQIFEQEISIVCDQRYGIKDLEKMVSLLNTDFL